MIFLDIKDYCHKCIHFEADVEKQTMMVAKPTGPYMGYYPKQTGDVIVRCKHRDICERMRIQFSHPEGGDLSDQT